MAGSSTIATLTLTEEYCRAMLLLHWPDWRKIADINHSGRKMTTFLSMESCPKILKAERARTPIQLDSISDEQDEVH